jgi:hypothetical protein
MLLNLRALVSQESAVVIPRYSGDSGNAEQVVATQSEEIEIDSG